MRRRALARGTARYHIEALGRGMAVLDCFIDGPPQLTLGEVSDRLKLNRATAYRVLRTLEHAGYLRQDPSTKRFALSLKALDLQSASLAALEIPAIVVPVLNEINERTTESCASAVLEGTQIRYIVRLPARRIIPINFPQVGATMPAHATSLGKALLAATPLAEVRAHYGGQRLEQFTPHTIKTVDALIEVLRHVAADGYAVSDEEIELGVRSTAAPVRGSDGHVVAAVAISTGTAHVSMRKLREEFVPQIVAAAKRISERLGYSREGTGRAVPRAKRRARRA